MGDIPLHFEILKSVVYIKNSFNQVGTGFLISKKMSNDKSTVFLITNKHVLQNKETGEFSQSIAVRFYLKQSGTSDGRIKWVSFPIFNNDKKIRDRIFLHPEESVDIAGLIVTDILVSHPELEPMSIPESAILTRERMEQEVINAGENVFILGYPAGIFSSANFLPLVKSGIISSATNEDLLLTLEKTTIKGKIFLVEAALFGGNSGGPVLIKPRWKVTKDKETLRQSVSLGEGLPLSLLGVNSGSIHLTDKIYTRVISELMISSDVVSSVIQNSEIKKDEKGEYIELKQDVMLNIVFSAEYLSDIFEECAKRFEIKKVQVPNEVIKTIPSTTEIN